ncbi:patatin-like phospholipase family protein [Jatrophihabitans sp. DSM 45814]
MSKAVVLGGGGSVGTAWQTALISSWAQAGVDLSSADLIVGTSAGAGVGVQVALGQDLTKQVERYRVSQRRYESGGPTAVLNFDAEQSKTVRDLYDDGHARGRTEKSSRQRISDVAGAAKTMSEDEFLRTFRYLNGEAWPPNYVCTTVDIDTAEFVALDHKLADDLVRGVAAAVAVPAVYPPITIRGHRYVDGGCLSTTFLDLAAGHDRILFVLMTEAPPAEYEAVEGSELLTIRPDADSRRSFGGDMMSAANAFGAVDTGLAQGIRTAAEVGHFWND